jgi:hypothetical protein
VSSCDVELQLQSSLYQQIGTAPFSSVFVERGTSDRVFVSPNASVTIGWTPVIIFDGFCLAVASLFSVMQGTVGQTLAIKSKTVFRPSLSSSVIGRAYSGDQSVLMSSMSSIGKRQNPLSLCELFLTSLSSKVHNSREIDEWMLWRPLGDGSVLDSVSRVETKTKKHLLH